MIGQQCKDSSADCCNGAHDNKVNLNSNTASGATRSQCDLYTTLPSQSRLDHIKKEHNLAKAEKADDTEVPVHLWDEKVFFGPPPPA